MDREALFGLIEEKINDIFLEYQNANNIKSGNITPIQLLKLIDIQNQLTDLIMEVGL